MQMTQQSYLSLKPSNTNSIAKCKQSLKACIKDIHKWMRTNKLKLNNEKTEVLLFGTRQQLEKLGEDNTFEIKLGSEVIKPTPSARNLGFHVEAQLKSQIHITKICGTAHSTIKNIARVQNLLTSEAAKITIQGLVISKFDYCNGLLLGVSAHQMNKLQIVQNMCCRIIKNLRKYYDISDAMKDLQCTQFKVLVTIYQCVNGLAPTFVIILLDLNLTRKNLR